MPPIKLHIERGRNKTQSVLIRHGEICRLGRSHRADLALAHDAQLADVHFQLDCTGNTNRLRDLSGIPGTFLNGEQQQEAVLYDGDIILAGRTQFRVEMEGAPRQTQAAADEAGTANGPGENQSPREAEGLAAYTQEDCLSGMTVFGGAENAPPGIDLMGGLASLLPLYILVDRDTSEEEQPLQFPDGEYLFDWLPDEAVGAISPLFCPVTDAQPCQPFLKQAWGRDTVVCLFSQTKKTELLGHLRRMVQYHPADAGEMEGVAEPAVLGLYRPSIMSMLLAHGDEDFVNELMTGVQAVLLESESGNSWKLFARSEFAETLQQLGYRRVEPTDP